MLADNPLESLTGKKAEQPSLSPAPNMPAIKTNVPPLHEGSSIQTMTNSCCNAGNILMIHVPELSTMTGQLMSPKSSQAAKMLWLTAGSSLSLCSHVAVPLLRSLLN